MMSHGMKLRYITLYFIFISFFLPYKVFAAPIDVSIDASRPIGKVPDFFSASIWLARIDKNEHMLKQFFMENRPATVQFTILSLKGSKSLEDYNRLLRKEFTTDIAIFIFKKIKEYNALPVIGFETGIMPSWLSSRSGDKRKATKYDWWTIEMLSPPKDYDLWAKVVENTLNFFIKEFSLQKIGLWIGHEPDQYWLGTDKSFFRFYEYAAKAAKKTNKDILVGGIGTADATSEKGACNYSIYTEEAKGLCHKEGGWRTNAYSMIKNFIEYVAKKKVPVDFINWHSFGVEPWRFSEVKKDINTWIQKVGIKNRVYLYVSDWTYWKNQYPADYLDTEESAAYIINALWRMYEAGIDWHGHDFDISDPPRETDIYLKHKNSEFIGDWPLFTRNGVIKPSYNAFKILNWAVKGDGNETRKLLLTEFPEDKGITALSTITKDKQKLFILISNHIPQEKRISGYLAHELKTFVKREGMKQKENWINTWLEEKKQQKQVSYIDSPSTKKELLNYMDQVYNCIVREEIEGCKNMTVPNLKDSENKKIGEVVNEALKSRNESRSIRVDISNLSLGREAYLTTYKIDNNHANACSYNKKTESNKDIKTMCGIEGAIDKETRGALKEASLRARTAAEKELLASGFKNEDIEILDITLKECNAANIHPGKCLEKLAFPGQKKEAIKQAYSTYQKMNRETYNGKIEAINKWQEISIEGTKKVETITIDNNSLAINMSMEPNSVVLLILQKK